jgi:3-(3-hydroxy-phenyl)propionate hydroxylase
VSPKGGALPGVRVLQDVKGLVAARYDARDGSAFLLRPDQHVCARWRGVDAARVRSAVARATCNA